MFPTFLRSSENTVALLAEGVDRNLEDRCELQEDGWSPSSRRAWIEIRTSPARSTSGWVALLTEGVDRNTFKIEEG